MLEKSSDLNQSAILRLHPRQIGQLLVLDAQALLVWPIWLEPLVDLEFLWNRTPECGVLRLQQLSGVFPPINR